jgi:uncharacterized membrane protein
MLPAFWKDKNFWIIVITAVLAILNEVLGMNIDSEAVWTIVLLVLGWVFKNGVVEGSIIAAMIRKEGYAATMKRFKEE